MMIVGMGVGRESVEALKALNRYIVTSLITKRVWTPSNVGLLARVPPGQGLSRLSNLFPTFKSPWHWTPSSACLELDCIDSWTKASALLLSRAGAGAIDSS